RADPLGVPAKECHYALLAVRLLLDERLELELRAETGVCFAGAEELVFDAGDQLARFGVAHDSHAAANDADRPIGVRGSPAFLLEDGDKFFVWNCGSVVRPDAFNLSLFCLLTAGVVGQSELVAVPSLFR